MRRPTLQERTEQEGREPLDRQNTRWFEEIRRECDHEWQPVSFCFENDQMDISSGRTSWRMPDLKRGRVYCVCMKCCSHTYIVTAWAGYYIGSPDLLESEPD